MASWIRREPEGIDRARSALLRRYDAYVQVLAANSEILELMADLESLSSAPASSGRRVLRARATRLGVRLCSMAGMFAVLSGDRHPGLSAAVDRIRRGLEEALGEPGPPPDVGPLVAPLGPAVAEAEGAFGAKASRLARMGARAEVSVPAGFAVSVAGFRAFLARNRIEDAVRIAFESLDPEDPEHLLDVSNRLQRAVLEGEMPPDLGEAMAREAARLAGTLPPGTLFSVRSSATGEDSAVSFAGRYISVLDVEPGRIPQAFVQVLAGFFGARAVLLRLERGFGALELGMGVLVLPMVAARAAGVAYSRDPVSGDAAAVVEAVAGLGRALVGGEARPWSWSLGRAAPGPRALPGGRAGEPPVGEEVVALAARLALAAEAEIGGPADVEWALDREGKLWLLQARPLVLASAGATPAGEASPSATILVEGGACASPGAAAGPVRIVRRMEEALRLPQGAVLVADEALPELAAGLALAAAVVAERGGVTGHLASAAREKGIPALLGVEDAVRLLGQAGTVTVDATGRRVLDGVDEGILAARRPRVPQPGAGAPGGPLRRLLPLVLPLTLRDPADPGFTPDGCRTVHDVVRFIHENALAEAIAPPGDESSSGGRWVRVEGPLPLDLRLVPLEGGFEAGPGARTVAVEGITCAPLRALIEGLLDPAVRRTGPPPIDAAGFLTAVTRSLASDPDLGRATWALVSDRYLHLSSRIGYHFATVEAMASPRPQDNRVRFAFQGGAADERRREHRARFVGDVLLGLGFGVVRKGDFVSGRLGQASLDRTREALADLGRLLACANRLDVLLASEALAIRYAEAFLSRDYRAILEGYPGAGRDAG